MASLLAVVLGTEPRKSVNNSKMLRSWDDSNTGNSLIDGLHCTAAFQLLKLRTTSVSTK